ncbi:hypothetical protein GCM10010991_16220 [Gemmobacter aquaticus]|uniref:Lipoprotein n=2 Tax=Gemmobacter aquaticus TaxID=490185 RepID=A0A918DDD3_9RHOB|nr:hypothetical protein GCM10010991_16220 [Gemmobacter aquaticus]
MNGANKILTVSYGTFSCTLEGFEDPFSMMKAIAEYFRELAAEDRYFGAEPPTPDAAMLHRLAEREIQRRVEAKIKENGVILRARNDDEPDAAADEMPAAAMAAVSMPMSQPSPIAEQPTPADSVAARLSRIRSRETPIDARTVPAYDEDEDTPVARMAPMPEPEADFGAEVDLVALTASVAEAALAEPEVETAAEAQTEIEATGIEAFTEDDEAQFDAAEAAPEVADLAAAIDLSGDDTVSAILARLSSDDEGQTQDDDFAETSADVAEAAQLDVDDSDEPYAEDLAGPEVAADDEDEDDFEDETIELAASGEEGTTDEAAEDDAGAVLPGRIQRARARIVRLRPADVADAEVVDEAPETAALEDKPVAEEPGRVIRPARPARPQQDPDRSFSAPPPQHPRFDALADESDPAVSRLLAETNSQMEGIENRRRLSAIQHLKAAVAATVAERRAGAAKPVNEEDRIDPYRSVLSRIMRPNQAAGSDEPAEIVKDEAPSEAPAKAPAMAPLVLVSAQRIDLPKTDNVTALRTMQLTNPARPPVLLTELVTREEDEVQPETTDYVDVGDEAALFSDVKGFAEFAERLGAENLPALLEAAAAYAACIEGRTYFSRPQIMRQVDAMTGESATREDALRSFGALLRTGRIIKVKRGQYALSDENDLLAEARKLVG